MTNQNHIIDRIEPTMRNIYHKFNKENFMKPQPCRTDNKNGSKNAYIRKAAVHIPCTERDELRPHKNQHKHTLCDQNLRFGLFFVRNFSRDSQNFMTEARSLCLRVWLIVIGNTSHFSTLGSIFIPS